MNISHLHLHKVVFPQWESNTVGRTAGTWHRVLVGCAADRVMVSPSHFPYNACYIPNHPIVLRRIMSSLNTMADNSANVTSLVDQPVGRS